MDGGIERCFGYLFSVDGRGIFSPDGRIEVTEEEAKVHNRLLSNAEVEGLDKCGIGQGCMFYFSGSKRSISTWVGDVVSGLLTIRGKVVTFWRCRRMFRGIIRKNEDCIFVKRVT
jgi:hypothetical protein